MLGTLSCGILQVGVEGRWSRRIHCVTMNQIQSEAARQENIQHAVGVLAHFSRRV